MTNISKIKRFDVEVENGKAYLVGNPDGKYCLFADVEAAQPAGEAAAYKAGRHAIRYRDNWDGEGDIYHLIAILHEDGSWTEDETGKKLLEYEGDEILQAWPLLTTQPAQPAPIAGEAVAGWIKWKGGKCPVQPDTLVDVLLRAAPAENEQHRNTLAGNWQWSHGGAVSQLDIVAYRISTAPPAQVPDALPDTGREKWTFGEWCEHFGGRHRDENPLNYYEFGSMWAIAKMLSSFGNTQQRIGWNACRAAMISAPQPSGGQS